MDGLAMQRSDVLDVATFKGSTDSPDGTPPSNSLAEEAYRSAYGTPTYRVEPRRKWLGTQWLPDVRKPSQRRRSADLRSGDTASRDNFTDIVGLMESGWYGPASSSYSTSDGSSFSGFHDSAASMALGHKSRKLANGTAETGSAASGSNNSSNHSGCSNGSAASSGNGHADVAEQLSEQLAPGTRHADGTLKRGAMAAVPEDSVTDDRVRNGTTAAARPERNGHRSDWLGTWAKRQVHYNPQPQPSLPAHIPGTPQASDRSARSRSASSKKRDQPRPQEAPGPSPSGNGIGSGSGDRVATDAAAEQPAQDAAAAEPADVAEEESAEGPMGRSEESDTLADDEEGLRQAAWRWRFNRRWAQEQARQMDPEYGRQTGDEDGCDEALGYMDACGPGWHLQIARTTSDDGLANGSLISHSGGLSNCFLADSQHSRTLATSGNASAMGEATKGIVQVARKAADLYEHQQAIENKVKERWDSASHAGVSWAGQELPAVQIDKFGKFAYVLVKLSDRLGGSKLLVRGKNGRTEQQLVSAVSKEVLGVTARSRLPQASVTLMGSGVMEWIRERDRVIHVSAGKMATGPDGSILCKDDIARLAAALTRASLPMHYRVILEGEKLS